MAASTDLRFNVSALDRASSAFIKMAQKVEKLSDKLEELDRKKVEPEIDVDVDKPLRKISRFGNDSTSIIGRAFTQMTTMSGLFQAAVVVGLLALPVAAAVAATGMVLAISGAFAGLGLFVAAQNKKVKNEFTDLKEHVVSEMKEISVPFQDTLMVIADTARETFDSFSPALEKSFKRMAPFISDFVKILGEAFEELKPAIEPMTEAFVAILDELGPHIGPLFENIAEALIDLAETVEANAPLFAKMFSGLLEIIPGVIKVVVFLANAFVGAIAAIKKTIQGFHEIAATVFSAVGIAVLTFVEIAITGFKFVVNAFLSFTDIMVSGAAKAFGWVPGIGPKLKSAKEKFSNFKDGVRDDFDSALAKTREWKEDLKKLPKEVKLKGDISNLKDKLADAKARLKRAPDEKKTKIKGEIDDLKAKIAIAQARLDNMRDRTLTVRVNYIDPGTSIADRIVIGGGGLATGGPVRPGQVSLVGEEGPELVRFGAAGRVFSNAESKQMARDVGGVGASASAAAVPDPRRWARDLVAEMLKAGLVVPRFNVAREADLYRRAG